MSGKPASPQSKKAPGGRLALRDYQRWAAEAARAESRPRRRIMLVLPTGSGKSWVISAIAAIAESEGKQILIVTPRRRLLVQIRKYLRDHGVVSGPIGNDLGDRHQLIVGTYQTMIRRKMIRPDVIIIDECHLVPPDSEYEKLLGRFPDAEIIGLTATPVRDDQHIACLGWETVFDVGMVELIEKGYLVPPRSVGTDGLRVSEADDEGEGRDVRTARIVPKLLSKVQQLNRTKCLLFCGSIRHAECTAKLLRAAGETAVHIVHSDQSTREQDHEMLGFEEAKERSWLVNVSIVGIGIDIPAVDVVVILRNVGSFALLVQMIGRGLRPAPGKDDCLVMDFGSGTSRYGFIDRPIHTLPSSMGRSTAEAVAMKECSSCGLLAYHNATACHCGSTFSFRATLNADAREVRLLSRDVHVARVVAEVVRRSENAWEWSCELWDGERSLRAVSFSLTRPATRYSRGASVLVERVGGDVVRVLSVAA